MNDLRSFIKGIDGLGELKHVRKADWDREIGAITEISASQPNPPALLFDEIKGYPKGFRILTNMFQTQSRTALSLGLPPTLKGVELVRAVKEMLRSVSPVPPRMRSDGPIKENILTGREADVLRLPAPKLHREDGGRYLGTADAVITRDPERGWVNLGTARVQVLNQHRVALYVSPGKQTRLIAQKYWERRESCPVAVVCGIDPVLFAVAGLGLPWGTSEYDIAGHIQKAPVDVVQGEMTGLPIPAFSEIVLEGEIPPPDVESEMEGPFGEWTGYYASGTRPSPVIRVKAVYHRNDPILTVLPDFKTYPLSSYMFLVFCAAGLWNEIEQAGITDIRGVWYAEWGIRFFAVISVKQRYGGHARQAAHIALGAREGAYLGRFVVLVDDDIDPSNMNDVLWALSTRCDPQSSIEIANQCWSSPIDPRLDPEKRAAGDFTNSRAILDACRPFSWRDRFPKVHSIDSEYQNEIRQKWKELLG
ncbi:MAG TPA: UbiD family decarboxylase [Candidatus Eisenbacteria bacterium]|nr:UbiD family decarboxylase [Candidatus Eisenbacteria bacterium]